MALRAVNDPSLLAQLNGDEAESPIDRNRAYAKPAPTGGYLTPLSPAEEKAFQGWVKQNNVPFDPSPQADYDMRGFWRAMVNGDPRATTGINSNDGQLHFGDYFKTPYHKSFSNESKWATSKAPRWNDRDQLVLPNGQIVFDERAQSGQPAQRSAAVAGGRQPVTDPALLAQLNAEEPASEATGRHPLARFGDNVVGGAELAGQVATGAVAAIPAGFAYTGAAIRKAFGADVNPSEEFRDTHSYLTYQPRTDAARSEAQAVGNFFRPVVEPVASYVGGKYGEATNAVARRNPFAGELMRAAPGAFEAASAVFPVATMARPAISGAAELARDVGTAARNTGSSVVRTVNRGLDRLGPAPTPEEVMSRMSANSQQSMGAASAAPSISSASPELRQAISRAAQKNAGAVNDAALARHLEAESLPVPVQLSEGQATQNVGLLSEERNLRGRHQQYADRFKDQNQKLVENVQALRDEVGPDVFSTNAPEHGDALISAYKAKNAAAQADINAKYRALEDANGGTFPVDAGSLLKNASDQLHKRLVFEHAPRSVMGQLTGMAENGMTFEQFEAMRTNLATIQRTAADGLERKAAGIIRSEMEKLPLSADAKGMKSLADDARKAAKAQFEALEADPAYDAAVNDSVTPDRFVNRFVINGSRDHVATMRRNLGDDTTALQTMGVAALDHLRAQARIMEDWSGTFAQKSYNKALQALSPKIRSLVSPQVAEQLERLGNVARYTSAQPAGSFVNNSNTFVAGAADHAATAVEGMANLKAGGVPVGTWTRHLLQNASARRRVRRSLAPGAGLDRLEPSAGPPPGRR